jgi:glutamyl-tRNA reductase
MGRFLKKHGFKNFAVFNRTLEKASTLANELGGLAYPLQELHLYQGGFDVIISCTGADHHVITPALYEQLLQGDQRPKTVIDIAIPQDLDPEIIAKHPVKHISVSLLQQISHENLQERSKELALEIVIRTNNTMTLEDQQNTKERIEKAIAQKTNEIKIEMPKYLWD